MALSIFDDPAAQPPPDAVSRVLGPSASHWTALIAFVRTIRPAVVERWHYTSARFGWSLRLEEGKRTLVHLTPQQGSFLAGLVLGEKAALAAETSAIPARALEALTSAPKYAEGRGIRMTVAKATDLRAVESLLELKLAKR
jgi:hypothetical protein